MLVVSTTHRLRPMIWQISATIWRSLGPVSWKQAVEKLVDMDPRKQLRQKYGNSR